jgi:ribosomal protein L40E
MANAGIGLGMMGGMGIGVGAVVADVTKDSLSPILGSVQGGSAGQPANPQSAVPPFVDLKEEAGDVPGAAAIGFACANCGAEIPPGGKFCTQCGTPAAVPEKSFCSKCGAALPEGGKFCTQCGAAKED